MAEGTVAAIGPAWSCASKLAARALMEFARLPVLALGDVLDLGIGMRDARIEVAQLLEQAVELSAQPRTQGVLAIFNLNPAVGRPPPGG